MYVNEVIAERVSHTLLAVRDLIERLRLFALFNLLFVFVDIGDTKTLNDLDKIN